MPTILSQATKRKRAKALAKTFGVDVADTAVCEGHVDPLTFFTAWIYDRPAQSLVQGPRGGGKSYLRALATHIDSLQHDNHETKILGGSEAQSMQIYSAVEEFASIHFAETELSPVVTATKAKYSTGSKVSYIPASQKSVRGPHVPSLCIDEVDEVDPEVRDGSIGMCMDMKGMTGSITMTSTWHKINGPMSELIAKGKSGAFPVYTFCAFETLERCPEERSGPNLEGCETCELKKWCHSDKDTHPSGLPKAKRSNGHYTIRSLIQKVGAVPERVFESDYLCLRPKASDIWFTEFDENLHVKASAEFNPHWPTHLAIDPGVHTGAVWFQVGHDGNGRTHINVFGDYYVVSISAESAAVQIAAKHNELTRMGSTRYARVSMDPAGNARTVIGPTVRGEYERAGLVGRNGLESWPGGKKADGLTLLEALIKSADDHVSIHVHPRCKPLIDALQSYVRARQAGELLDRPKDPQHDTGEDLIDPLCGGLKLEFPEGRTPPPNFQRRHAAHI